MFQFEINKQYERELKGKKKKVIVKLTKETDKAYRFTIEYEIEFKNKIEKNNNHVWTPKSLTTIEGNKVITENGKRLNLDLNFQFLAYIIYGINDFGIDK